LQIKKDKRFHLIPTFLRSLLAVGLNLNALNNSFIFDDIPTIIEDPCIRNVKSLPLFWKGLKVPKGWFRVLPKFFAAYYHLGGLYSKTGRAREAISEFEKA